MKRELRALTSDWPPAAPTGLSHTDGAVPPTENAENVELPGSDKRRVVQRWRGTMGQFERRR